MDALKTKRKSLRTSFTATANKLKECLAKKEDAKDGDKLRALNSQLEDKFLRLDEIQNKISSLLLENTDTAAEYETDFQAAEDYRDNFLELKSKLETLLNKDSGSFLESSSELDVVKLNLPKFELKMFSGDPKEFLTFWSIFSKIHDSEELTAIDKFQYLYQSMVPDSRAARLISSFPITTENYPKAVEQLKLRFGREDLLVQIYVRDLLSLVLKNATTGKNAPDLATLYDMLETKLRALESLGRTKEKFADFLEPLVESCLPENVLRAWERSRISESTEDATSQRSLEKLMCFLRHEVESEEMICLAREGFGKDRGSGVIRKDCQKSVYKDEPTAATLISSTTGAKLNCIFCDRPHLSQDCQRLSDMSYEDRKSQVIRKRCCLVCLKVGHLAKRCHSSVRCLICKRRHYPLLCPDLRKEKESNLSSKDRTADTEQRSTETLLTNIPSEHEIYLKTIMIRLRNRDKEVCVRALLDDGSQRSYIERSLAAELFLSPSGREIFSQGLFGGGISPASEHKRYMVNVESLNRKYSTPLSLLEQQKICSTLPRIHDRKLLSELASRGIKLTDVGRDSPPIRVLLGADILGSILTGRIEVLSSGVSAVETLLGWTILGLGKKKEVVNLVTLSLQNMDVPKMWDLEVLVITDPIEKINESLLEEETLTHFKETIRICEDQRYEVALPWLAGHPALYDKYDAAESRLRTATKRLINENYFEAYNNVFKQWEAEGIIEAVPINQLAKEVHYLPHRPVIKPSSNTTKVRPVFDASFKKPGFASLNECLSVGPSLTHKILPLLLRFRSGAIGVIADVKQAFLQIRLRTEDRDVLRFLWWENTGCSEIRIYRHCRVVFGVSSSPFLLNATISYHLEREKFQTESLRKTIGHLKEGFYVDNLVTSVNDATELEQLKSQSIEIMKEGAFELRCWASNDSKEDQDKQMVLGLSWDVVSDELSCKLPANTDCTQEKPVTKRVLLSVINSVYDPIGFTAPALLLPKLLMQEAWRRKIGWDEVLPVELEHKYRLWEKTMHFMSKCSISRSLFAENYDDFTLHIFTDASAYAYATCAFLRCEFKGQVTVKLIVAKARLAPMKKSTIPRLELLGAALGARLAETVDSILRTASKTYFWCDSMVVLSWIKKKEPWNTFVGNRVKEIRDLTNIDDWRHVPGEVNPANLATRCCDWSDLLQSKWWEVPISCITMRILYDAEVSETPDEAFLERRKTVVTNLATGNEYLGELVRSPKVASKRKMISPGEIVIVESKNPNRMNWPLAQVIELFPGKDGVERVAKLRLASGEIIRPLQRIYPLELSASDHLIEDHQGTHIAAQNPGPTAADVLEEVKKSRCGRPLIPVKRLNL
ncbi:hypothetical protein AVEN_48012-1 [Araneus ventricosus]|uniref:DUF5641 domain-containing protein n=3 Tax=Araneus ventricosus TaxID=182803 RepID=A0A4Y2UH07_ARAVE|nr:hypothetical protein AVEN_48012-1 [Araneus ventricosus]